ncbi:hypothetical protein LTR84_003840 [Exophiala bonariae]|uniref:Myb-like DNA-binding domain-containing protein n=1 Tax=Exophiala bonariae TaxID=1690606 RepID=A0AAV9N677_9EURO|nr:hypothetical protein LTR84_003840 [Exophiala bonariae]
MASLRRSKNYASDAQTPMFLYAILKQLDLRSVDWNAVADKLDISNGHAARMRYSRMKTQFEGVPTQPRAPRPKKEKANNKPAAKDTTKGKRQLLEEEEERLNKEQVINSEVVYPAGKRCKRNAELEVTASFHPLRRNIYERFVDPHWPAPMIRVETPMNGTTGNTSIDDPRTQPIVKEEPGGCSSHLSNLSPFIKKESVGLLEHSTSTAATHGNIKIEPGWTDAFDTSDSFLTNTRTGGFQISSHADGVMRRPFFQHPGNSAVPTIDPSCLITRTRPEPMGVSPFLRHRPIADYFPVQPPAPCLNTNFMFNSNATTFEDMLTMPLQECNQSDIGTDGLAAGTDTTIMDPGSLNAPCAAEVITHAKPQLELSSNDVGHFDQFVELSPQPPMAAETGSMANEATADENRENDSNTDVTTTSENDNQDGVYEVENVQIKQEIIEIYD